MPAIHHLIVDPSPAVQTFIRTMLESYGFDAASIKTASNPQAAIELAADIKPDFLLTDWFGKDAINGIDLHEAVINHNPSCTFALMAAAPSPQQEVDADMAGAFFLLPKPFTADQFRGVLAKAMVELSKKHPQIAQKIATHTAGAVKVPKMAMPDIPQFKPGDQVTYKDRRESVKHVILRRGELVVQLNGIPGLVEATRIKRL
jgi:two-component system chemotaxis response regulator CheY